MTVDADDYEVDFKEDEEKIYNRNLHGRPNCDSLWAIMLMPNV